MNLNFNDKIVLVTGASAGIGEAIALLFAKLGATLALVGRNAENLKNVASRCEKEKGVKALEIVADISTDAGCDKIAKETIEKFGRLDVLVNNAGVGARTGLEGSDMETYDRVFDTNVRGVYNLTRQLLPALLQSKGNIVNISSVAGSAVYMGALPYSMSKAALDHFTRVTALELASRGVRVNTVSPGVTVSTLVQRVTNYTDEQYKAWLDEAVRSIPAGEVCAGDDIAYTTVYLASPYAAFITGAVLAVDGGVRFTAGGGSLLANQIADVKKAQKLSNQP